MKKSIYFILLLTGLFAVTGCSNTTSSARDGFESFDGQAISDSEAQIIGCSARENTAQLSRIGISMSGLSDNTFLYTKSLSLEAQSINTSVNGSVTVYSNHAIDETLTNEYEKTSGTGAKESNYVKEISIEWVGAAIDPLLTNQLSLFSKTTRSDFSGNVLSENSNVTKASFSTQAALSDDWSRYILDVYGRIYEYDSSQSFFKKTDGTYIATYSKASKSTISNPLYPGDSTKTIACHSIQEEDFVFSETSAGSFVLTKQVQIEKSFVLTDFSFVKFSEPAVIESSVLTYEFSYDDRTIASLPTFTAEESVVAPVLTSFTPTDSGANYQTSSGLSNISVYYKMLNPTFKGYAFRAEIALSSSLFYAFSTQEDVDATTPITDKWGFNKVISDSKVYGAITSANVSGKDYFKVMEAKYSILILFDVNQQLQSICMSYLGK